MQLSLNWIKSYEHAPNMTNEKPPSKNELNLWDLSSLGVEFSFIIVLFIYLGNFIDEKFLFEPFGIIFFSIFGFAFGIYYIIHRSRRK